MLHRQRRWCVTTVASVEELAANLHRYTRCGCAGFRLGDYLLLNDSTGPDGAQEYAVVQCVGGPDGAIGYRQIESITASWISQERLVEFLCRLLVREFDDADWACNVTLALDTPADHDGCSLCA